MCQVFPSMKVTICTDELLHFLLTCFFIVLPLKKKSLAVILPATGVKRASRLSINIQFLSFRGTFPEYVYIILLIILAINLIKYELDVDGFK
jgi:hypothetical protein